MHKKPLIAVLALGLLLFASVTVFATDYDPANGVYPKGDAGRTPQSKGTPSVEAASGSLVTVNAGTNRVVPGTFCDGRWQGAYAYSVGGWYVGMEFYAAYQDPSNASWWNGTCVNTPSFDVTAINMINRFSAGPFPMTFVFQPLVYGVSSTAECAIAPAPVAGGALCVGPAYAVTWTAAATYIINLPFPIECCLSGPFFAAWYSPTGGALRLGCNAGYPAPMGVTCGVFNEYGLGWDELSKYFTWPDPGPYNLEYILFAEGYTPDDPATHCTPGLCDWQWHYVGEAADCGTGTPGLRNNDCWEAYYPLPSGVAGGRTKEAVLFQAIGLDTLKGVEFILYGAGTTDDWQVEIFGDLGFTRACGPVPDPAMGGLLYSVVIPNASLIWDGATPNYVAIPDIIWGTLNGGLPQNLFVAISPVQTAGGVGCIAYGPPFAGPSCPPSPMFSMAYYPFATFNGGVATWEYLAQAQGTGREFGINAYVCKEKVPIVPAHCTTPGPDVWNQWGHDAQRTSFSSIAVGDPNGIKLEWAQSLPRLNSFCSPTVANDRVYISSDQEVTCWDLATGAFLGDFKGAPEMGSSNRGNTTIDAAGNVYATGGNFNAITKMGPNLEASGIIWSVNTSYGPVPGGLSGQNRFNTCVVANVSGTDVVFVATEPFGAPGQLYALDAATGALWGNWPTNPITFDAAVAHGPTFDGSYLYVGTQIGGTLNTGSLYKIDATNGAFQWGAVNGGVGWVDVAGDGWPGGVSVEGSYLYGATRNGDNTGRRYKLDVSSNVTPSIVWKFNQGVVLYGAPAIGNNFVYIPQDNPSFGLLMIDKAIGLAVHNFSAEGVASVTQSATISCDKYVFAGDRDGYWHLLNANNQSKEWSLGYVHTGGDIVMGTALASHSTNTYDYAAVSVRQITTAGLLLVYRLNTGPRPRLVQHEFEIDVPIPFGTDVSVTVDDAFENIGNAALNFTALNIADPLPDGSAASIRHARQDLMQRRSLYPSVDADYNSYFTDASLTKQQHMAGLSTRMIDGELTCNPVLVEGSKRSENRMAAGASNVRVGNVKINGAAIPTAIGAGAFGDLTFDINGTVPYLGRGIDLNIIELTNDDPDFDFLPPHSVAEFGVTAVGGCLFAADTLYFGDVHGAATANYETMYNHGNLGDDASSSREFRFVADGGSPDNNFYDGTFMLFGDSSAAIGGAQLFVDMFGGQENYAGNPQPPGGCAMQKATNVVLGRYRTGGGPVDIYGEWIQSAYSDTDFAAPAGTPLAAIGFDILQKEVGAYDPLYGDFKLIHWTFTNRIPPFGDGLAKGPIYPGTHIDWDINTGANTGLVSDLFNGYAQWDAGVNATIAYGMFDVNMPSTYDGIDPAPNSPHGIYVISNPDRIYSNYWNYSDGPGRTGVWGDVMNIFPARMIDNPGTYEDKSSVLIGKPFSLGAGATTAEWTAAVYGVDASTDNAATIEQNALGVAKRAARWAGFARGNVNEDAFVDLADVAWMIALLPKYPGDYCGDVNADGLNDGADVTKLLSWVSGHPADRPVGAWRF
ncbi:MAG: hypothetical protein AB1792_01305 [Candidatus Zixiibacteriota bacterium]